MILMSAGILACAMPAEAKVKRIVINKTKSESPAFSGKSFGKSGLYETIVGRAYGASTRKTLTTRSSKTSNWLPAILAAWWNTPQHLR